MPKVTVIIGADGRMQAFVNKSEGEFAPAKLALERLVKLLGQDGLDFDDVGQVEQHTHELTGVQNHVHVGGNNG